MERLLNTVSDPALADAIGAALRTANGVVEQVTELDARRRGIVDVTDVDELAGLRSLRIDDNAVRDLALVARLPALAGLSAADNRIEDLAPLGPLRACRACVWPATRSVTCRPWSRPNT